MCWGWQCDHLYNREEHLGRLVEVSFCGAVCDQTQSKTNAKLFSIDFTDGTARPSTPEEQQQRPESTPCSVFARCVLFGGWHWVFRPCKKRGRQQETVAFCCPRLHTELFLEAWNGERHLPVSRKVRHSTGGWHGVLHESATISSRVARGWDGFSPPRGWA